MKYETQIIDESCNLISIPSTKSEAAAEKPFGAAIDQALDYYLNLANSLGLNTTKDVNGYYGLVEYGDQSDPLAILGHLDVVNGGSEANWTITKPFEPRIVDNTLYGRGAEDMKLSMVTILYVIKELIDQGHQFKRGVRIIVGTDEENEFRCVKEYAKENKFPSLGFTPDGSFPVVNVETSLIELEFTSKQKHNFVISGGADFNTVADVAYYEGDKALDFAAYLTEQEVDFSIVEQRVTVYGKSVHVSDIEAGESAISLLAYHLYQFGIHTTTTDLIAENFKLETNAKSFLGVVNDQFTGDLVCNFGLLKIDHNGEYLGIDLRIPVMYDQDIILTRFAYLAKTYNLENNVYFNDRKVYVDEQAKIVQTALKAYEKVTGEMGECINSRGGSYSKVAPNYVGIGMNFPQLGQTSTAHQSNEAYDLRYLRKACEIFEDVIKELTK